MMIPFDSTGAFRPVKEDGELRRLALRGAAATVTAQGLALVVQIVSTVILARLLMPADFGVVAMVTTFSLLLMSFGPNGFTEVIIQRDELDRFQASNLFWINSGAGLLFAIALAAGGELLSQFYRNPLVTRVSLGVAPAVFIASASVIHLALLKRDMRFASASSTDVAGRIANTVLAIVLALRGWGYWALVAGIVAQALTTTVAAWCLCPWIPSLPRRGLGTRAMLKFAVSVYGGFGVNYMTRNLDNLLVGWRFNAIALGLYKKAYDLFALSATQVTGPLHEVALAALSRLQHDPVRFRRYLASSLGVVAMVGMGMGADLTLVGKDVVRLVLGAKWWESGTIFVFFGPGIGMMLLNSTVGWIHLSIGKPERRLRWMIFAALVTALSFVVALPWGPEGIAAAWTVSFWILAIPAFWYAGRPIGFDVSSFLGAIWKYVVASLIAGLASAIIIQHVLTLNVATTAAQALEFTVVKSLLFTVLYLGAVILLYGGCDPLYRVAGLLREVLPGASRAKSAATSEGGIADPSGPPSPAAYENYENNVR